MGGTAYHGLGPPTSIVDKENAPQICLQASLMDTVPVPASWKSCLSSHPDLL